MFPLVFENISYQQQQDLVGIALLYIGSYTLKTFNVVELVWSLVNAQQKISPLKISGEQLLSGIYFFKAMLVLKIISSINALLCIPKFNQQFTTFFFSLQWVSESQKTRSWLCKFSLHWIYICYLWRSVCWLYWSM